MGGSPATADHPNDDSAATSPPPQREHSGEFADDPPIYDDPTNLLNDIVEISLNRRSAIVKCFNRNVLIGLGVVAVALFFLAPSARSVLPLLLVAACPLSMMVMVFGMSKMGSAGKPRGTDQPNPQQALELKDAEITRLEAMLQNSNRTDRS